MAFNELFGLGTAVACESSDDGVYAVAAKGGGDAARSKSAKRVNINGISTE